MDEENLIGGKFSIDISELSKGLKQANKLINLSNSEFKAATAGMDKWQDSAEGISARIKNLNDVTDLQRKKVDALQGEYDRLISEGYSPLSREVVDLQTKINKETATLKANEAELSKCVDSLKEIQSSSTKTISAIEQLTSEIGEQEDELKKLQKEYSNLVLEQGEGSKEAKDLKAQMTKLNDSLKENKSELNKAESASDKFTDALKDIDSGVDDANGGFTILKGALADLTSNIIQGAVSKIGELVSALFTLDEATEEYRKMNAKLEGSAQNFGYSVEFANEKYKEFYKYLGDDMMATNAVTNLMGLRTSTESLSKLAEGATAVWASYGDSIPIESLTESINETIQVSKVTGTFADTINWAKITNEQMAASLGNGSNAQKAFNEAIKEGETQEDAFSAALSATKDEQERANIVAQFLNSTYGESKKTYDEMTGSIQDAKTAELELKETQAELAETISPINNLLTELKNDALLALQPVIEKVAEKFLEFMNYLKEHPTLAKILTATVIALATAFTVLASALAIQALINGVTKAMSLLNLTMLANPYVLIAAAIAGLVAGFIYLWNNCEGFRQFWINLWEILKTSFITAWTAISNFFTVTIPEKFEQLKTTLQTWINNVKQFFIDGWNSIVEFFTVKIPEFFAKLGEWFNSLPQKLGYLIGQLIGHIILFYVRLWEFATVDIPNFIAKMIEWFATLPGRIWEWLVNAYNKVTTWGSNIIKTGKEKGKQFLDSVISFFKELPGEIWDWLVKTFNNIVTWGEDMIETGKEKIGEFVEGIIEKVTGLPEEMKKAGKDVLDGFVNGVKEKFESAKKKVTDFFSGIADGVRDVLNINSPSKVFAEMGMYSAEGYGLGFEKEIDKVKKSLTNSMDLGNDLNVNLGRTKSMSSNSNSGINNKSIIVNQTINSPKAVDRKEIYRRTKNVATMIATANG